MDENEDNEDDSGRYTRVPVFPNRLIIAVEVRPKIGIRPASSTGPSTRMWPSTATVIGIPVTGLPLPTLSSRCPPVGLVDQRVPSRIDQLHPVRSLG